MIAQWRFKIITCCDSNKVKSAHPLVIVGIVDANNIPTMFNAYWRNHGYGYYARNGYLLEKHGSYPYGSMWRKGDIVTMTLDMRGLNGVQCGTLSFEVNEEPQGEDGGVAVNFLNLDKKYRMMMSCFNAGVKIQILFN